ncbi:MAG TPA: outer membrane beta-barrel protein [Thermoanaerobaculia bacterium]|nr:outer membrane beta-barrel protein [Thermoanaerobaculia bacterium]
MRTSAALAAALFLAVPLLAQPTVDVTAFAGYRWGGTIDDDGFYAEGEELSVADSGSVGAIVGFGLGPNLSLELSVSRQQSELESSFGIFDPETVLGDVDLTYYQAGVTFEWGRDVRPFFGASLGAATIDPDIPETSSETRFAGSFSAGVKLHLSDHVGLRLDGKMLWIALEGEDDCYSLCYEDGMYGDGMLQGEVAAGVIIFF